MEEKISLYLTNLDGITYKEWRVLKTIIENKFVEEKEKSTFKIDESTSENLKAICQ